MRILRGKGLVTFIISISILFIFCINNIYAKNINNDLVKQNVLKDKYSGKKLEKIKNTIKGKKNYRFLINTSDTLESINNYFENGDKQAKIKQIGKTKYMVRLPLNSSFLSEELSLIDNGILPTQIGIYDVIQPEIVESLETEYILGEETEKLWGNTYIGADTFQEELQTNQKIKVGILDTGIDYNHADLDDNYNSILSYDFVNEDNDAIDDNGHGTQVAGIIGAEVNGEGRYGVNSNSDLVGLKVLDVDGLGTSYDILEAIEYAKQNDIKVLNMSFGGVGSPENNAVCEAITNAKNNGIFTVVSAGNSDSDSIITIPAACPDSITVGSIDDQNEKSTFSNYGTGVTLYYPGINIYTTNINQTYKTVEGTSFSAAFISGLVAKELAFNGGISYVDLINNIHSNYNLMSSIVDPSLKEEGEIYYGTGEVIPATELLLQETFAEPGLFIAEGNTYPWIQSNGIRNCGRIETATFSNGYSLKHYTLVQDFTKHIGRTELYKDGSLIEYQDNVFYGDNGYPNFSGNSCYLTSKFRSVILRDNGTIDINYNFWTGFKWQYGVKTTKFTLNKKNISDISVSTSVFGYPNHFYIKLNLKDENISETINIASKGTFNDLWRTITATRGSWLWGARRFGERGCTINNVTEDDENYNVNYTCIVTRSRSSGAANGSGYTYEDDIIGSFTLSKEDYNLCSYSESFCSSGYIGRLPWETYWEYSTKINEGIVSDEMNPDNITGDPVNLNTGEFIYNNVVMQHNSKGFPFNFEINYRNKTFYEGTLGSNFDHSYNITLSEQSDGNIYFNNGKLGVFEFIKNDTGFDYNKTINAELKLVDGKYNLVLNNTKTLVFNADLKIELINDNFGNTFSFIYDTDNLTKIIDSNNREYNLSYNTDLKLQNITDFNGDKVEFIYFLAGETEGSENDLKTIKIVNNLSEKEINFTYTISETEELSHNIIKLIDSENNIYVENTYDEFDRVSSQKFGSESIHYIYTTDAEDKIMQNSVIDREGNNVIYTYDSNGNTIKKVVKKITGDSIYSYEYNPDNYITKEILPLGNGYTFKYDINNNLIEKRQKADINALDSDEDIITSYTYNLDFNKPIQIVSPNGAIINFELDNNGNITSKEILGVSDIDGVFQTIVENYEYNILGELISKIDANGNIISFEYLNGNLVKSIKKGPHLNPLPEGEEIATEYSYDSKGNISSITDGEGNITNLSYNDFNLLNNLTTPEGIVSKYNYNKLNKKVNESIILGDLSKVTTDYEYDILDNPTKIKRNIDSSKEKVIVTKYDNNSNITEITDGNNAVVQFVYNEQSYITEKKVISGTNNIITKYTYDENNRLIKQINPNNSEVIFEYDLFDRIVKQTLSNGVYITLNYDKTGNILETKTYNSNNELLQKESNSYDKLGRNIKKIIPILNSFPSVEEKEATSKTYYDAVGNIIKITSPQSSPTGEEVATFYSYDSFNRLSQVVDNLGNIITNTYNKNDKLISRTITGTDGKIVTTSYEYDNDSRLIKEINSLGEFVSYTYNNLNQVVSKTNKDLGVTEYKYNYSGNITEEKIIDSIDGDKTTKYEYDINGNRTKVIDSNNNETIYEYDNLNRIIKQTYPDGNTLIQVYDISGNLTKRTDPNGTIITNNYDELNRLTSRDIQTGTGVLGATSETYTYDELGRVIGGTDNLNNELSFSYDSLNRLITETSPHPNPLPEGEGIATTNYTYDVNGNILSINNTNYAYDISNRLLSVKNGTKDIANYTYNSLTQLSQTLGNGITTNYSYDELLRLSSLGDFDYVYNTNGNITSDGTDYYSYDEQDRITGVNYDQVNIPQYNGDKIERFFYDSVGNRISQENYTLKDVSTETCTDETVVEDIVLPNGKTKTVEKKQRVCETAVTQVEKERNTITYDTNNLNQYTKLQNLNKNDEVKKEFTYIYDNNGNLTKDDINGYFYDYKNRLVKVVQNEVIKVDENGIITETIPEEELVSYEYDILGRRIKKQTVEKTVNYIYAGQNAIKEIITSNETNQIIETRENIYSNNLDDILSTIITDYTKEIPENNQYFYEKNHLGSITKITDTNGLTIEQYEYDIFGVAYASVNNIEAVTTAKNKKTLSIRKGKGSETSNLGDSDELTIDNIRYKRYNGKGKIGNTRLYTGREYDAELKLYYNRARYYSPDLGRFISRDPIDVSDDVNLYAYVGNNGVMFVDRNGLSKALIFIGKDKLIFGMESGVLLKAANIQYNDYIEQGYKKENILVVFGDTITSLIETIGTDNYKDIGLVSHSSNSRIDLDSTGNNELDSINNSTLNMLPVYGGEDTILTIIGCLAGNGDNPIAEKIANQMNITVIASDELIRASDKGYFIDGGDSIYDAVEGIYNNIIGKESNFIIFNPN